MSDRKFSNIVIGALVILIVVSASLGLWCCQGWRVEERSSKFWHGQYDRKIDGLITEEVAVAQNAREKAEVDMMAMRSRLVGARTRVRDLEAALEKRDAELAEERLTRERIQEGFINFQNETHDKEAAMNGQLAKCRAELARRPKCPCDCNHPLIVPVPQKRGRK